jgi:hypothetical protein
MGGGGRRPGGGFFFPGLLDDARGLSPSGAGSRNGRCLVCCLACPSQISIMKMVKHDHVVKLYEVLASRTKVGGVCCWLVPSTCSGASPRGTPRSLLRVYG